MSVKHGLNAASLRLLAMGLMLVDHVGAVLFPQALWMRMLGRLAFPIFAFQVAEGYRHTRDFRKYCLRLLLFALVTEIPFDLMLGGSVMYPLHQNVLFTLLMGLVVIRQIDKLREEQTIVGTLIRYGKILLITLAGTLMLVDYGLLGILTVVVFYVVRGYSGAWLIQLCLLAGIHVYGYQGMNVSLFSGAVEFPLQGFALLALVPIWMYNGEKGPGGKWLQYGSYLFYPVHMLILWLITTV